MAEAARQLDPRLSGYSQAELGNMVRMEIAARVARARTGAADFLSFVIRPEEDARRPDESFQDRRPPLDTLEVPPHQKVTVDFALHHPMSVVMLPADHAKTTTMAGLGLYLLAKDPTLRGAIVSATQTQAEKVLKQVKDHIDGSWRLRAVAPGLRPSPRAGDPWTQTSITVERPPGIRDPSLVALGMDGPIIGSRLDWIVVDDILTVENTLTQEQRLKTVQWFFKAVVSRLVKQGGRLVVCNTAFHPEDLLHVLRDKGWPTLRMDIEGNVWVYGDTDFGLEGKPGATDLRDATPDDGPAAEPFALRLVGNDNEPQGRRTLWPDRYDSAGVDVLRRNIAFNQLYMNITRDDDQAMCKAEYIELCKEVARQHDIQGLTASYDASKATGYVFTGVDLAVSRGEEADYTAFFTFEVRPTGLRVILDVEYGRFAGPVIVQKLFDKHTRYNSEIIVENNGAQDFIRQWALDKDVSLPVSPYTTGRTKAHPEYGVPSLFTEMANGAWAIPNRGGQCHPAVQRFIDDCLYYVPSKHTGDVLMACFFARERAKKFGVPDAPGVQRAAAGLSILAR